MSALELGIWMAVDLRVGIEQPILWNQLTPKIAFRQNRAFHLRIGRSRPPFSSVATLLLRRLKFDPAAPPMVTARYPRLPPSAGGLPPSFVGGHTTSSPVSVHQAAAPHRPLLPSSSGRHTSSSSASICRRAGRPSFPPLAGVRVCSPSSLLRRAVPPLSSSLLTLARVFNFGRKFLKFPKFRVSQ
jgi:hypothetical protein